jgi:hypothetical protein
MGFYTPPQQNNIFSSLVNNVKNMFKAPKQRAPYPGAGPQAPGVPNFYQVKEDDNSLDNVANNLNIPLPQLVAANNGIKSLPPKGSYIQTQPEQLVNQGMPPSVAEGLAQKGAVSTTPTNSFVTGAGTVNLTELNATIQQQVASGSLPQQVSFYTPILNPSTGQPVTDAEMQANGYAYDNLSKSWKLGTSNNGTQPGTPAPQNGPDPYSEVKSVFFSKSRGYVTPEVAALLLKKRRSKQGGGGPAKLADNAGGGPTSVLNTQLGSG